VSKKKSIFLGKLGLSKVSFEYKKWIYLD
jgi:hypothetical protein